MNLVVYLEDIGAFDGIVSDEDLGTIIRMLCRMVETGIEPEEYSLSGPALAMYRIMVNKVKRDMESYQRMVEAGNKGGRPRKNSKTQGFSDAPQKNPGFLESDQKKPRVTTVSVSETVSETETESVSVSVSEPSGGKIPPTLGEIDAYRRQNNKKTDPARFYHYYAAKNWELKPGVKMTDWVAAYEYWESNEGRYSGGSGGNQNIAGSSGDNGTGPYDYGFHL